jgi:hypothetical protein
LLAKSELKPQQRDKETEFTLTLALYRQVNIDATNSGNFEDYINEIIEI